MGSTNNKPFLQLQSVGVQKLWRCGGLEPGEPASDAVRAPERPPHRRRPAQEGGRPRTEVVLVPEHCQGEQHWSRAANRPWHRQALFLDTFSVVFWPLLHTSTMARDVTDIHSSLLLAVCRELVPSWVIDSDTYFFLFIGY